MIGHGQKLTRKQESAIAALLTCPTVTAAATACGVSAPTLYRWLRDAEFRAAFEIARHTLVRDAIGTVQLSINEAVSALRRHLTCGQPAVECRAATALIDLAIRTVAITEIDQRLALLEEAQQVGGGLRR
ncbi:MAG: hypothetical protein GX446_15765 [Chthonomonadales bacterium]|nr:hypothetical protein [Chthonomonadales bacterium]